MTQPTFKRHHPIIYGQNNSGRSNGNFRGNGNKGISNNKGQHGQSKNAKVNFKRHNKSTIFDKGLKWERSTSDRNYDSWNIAKRRLLAEELNKRQKTNAYINCCKAGRVFNGCPKPKPWLLECIVDIADSTP